jgi:phosphohistidine swiveling domain-containing protein
MPHVSGLRNVTPSTTTGAAPFVFGTKADTLFALSGMLKTARILPLVSFSVAQWQSGRAAILTRLEAELSGRGQPLIVRSSAHAEDTLTASNAGAFLSVSNVKTQGELEAAIDAVINSYDTSPTNQVLVQPFVSHVQLAGVALTRDAATGGHYFIINYDESGGTDGVTGGSSKATKTYICSKSTAQDVPPPMGQVLALARELEILTGLDMLDIEFALAADGTLYLFQVRPLVLPSGGGVTQQEQHVLLSDIERSIDVGMQPHPHLHGVRTAYGVMPDWNPAEIIGIRPRPLALSLYRDLVTDSIWSYQRNNYGYKNLRSFPLMVHFYGLPYIDVRVSLNSFIPRDIDGPLADQLANHYLDRLLAAPSMHDKVEFEIVYSCYTFDLDKRLANLKAFAFSDADIAALSQSLRELTNGIIRRDGLWHLDREKLAILQERHTRIMSAKMTQQQRIYWLLEDCKRYGTLPFAGLARAGFIAVQMLRSLVTTGILSQAEYDVFMAGLNTVSSQMTYDFSSADRYRFLEKYGHLRPGTYDINSARYDEAPDLYFKWPKKPQAAPEHKRSEFSLSISKMREINRLLEHHGLEYDSVGLLEFISTSIEWREQSKFIFSRSLSDALLELKQWGESLGFSCDDMSYTDINVIRELSVACVNAKDLLAESIAHGRTRYEKTLQLHLPPLISQPQDAWGFFMPGCEPNFVTRKSVTALVASHTQKSDLAGAIVVIESADPGFDWIFSHGIAGLITAYGGTNSHMAIRAGELGLPAIIGAGETLFHRWKSARMLHIDCATQQVDMLS